MNQQRTQNLTRLLQKVMKNVVIRHTSKNPPSIDEYRDGLRARRTSYRPDLFELTLPLVYPEIQDSGVKKDLLKFIQGELAEYIHEGNIHTPTFTGDAFPGHDPLEQMLWNLLKTTIVWGVDKAVLDFERCVEAKSGSFLRIALLKGASVRTELEVYEGIRLVPLPTSPRCFPKYMPDGFMFGVTTRAFTSETLLEMDFCVTPLFSKPVEGGSAQFREALSSKDAPCFDLDMFCQFLSLAANAAIRSEFEWEYFDENEMSMLSQTGGHRTFWGSPKPSYVPGDFVEVSEAQVHKAKSLYQCWNNLARGVQKALKTPIDRWMKSKMSRDSIDRMIDLGIALESLYLPNNREQLSFTFRLRAAWYLGEDREERKSLLAEFKRIYDWRSQAVHQGSLPDEERVNGESVSQSDFIQRAQDLCLMSILRVMREGHVPDWDSLILGGDGN